jgi:hypothetical protein
MGTHYTYPKGRKSYIPTNSQKYKLIQDHGLEKIKEVWSTGGMYHASEIFKASPKVIWHLAHDYG